MSFEDDYELSVAALIAQFLLLVLPVLQRHVYVYVQQLVPVDYITPLILGGKETATHTSQGISLHTAVDETVNHRWYAKGHLNTVSRVMDQTTHSMLLWFDSRERLFDCLSFNLYGCASSNRKRPSNVSSSLFDKKIKCHKHPWAEARRQYAGQRVLTISFLRTCESVIELPRMHGVTDHRSRDCVTWPFPWHAASVFSAFVWVNVQVWTIERSSRSVPL